MPTDERAVEKRKPRIDPPSQRVESEGSNLNAQLRAELDSVRQQLAEVEARLASLERTYERRERRVRACSMCGRVTTQPGPDADCPYCKTGKLDRV